MLDFQFNTLDYFLPILFSSIFFVLIFAVVIFLWSKISKKSMRDLLPWRSQCSNNNPTRYYNRRDF